MENSVKEIHLKDYKRPYFWIKHTDLDFVIGEASTVVTSTLTIERNKEFDKIHDLVLDGVELKLLGLVINDSALDKSLYKQDDKTLTISTNLDNFNLKTTVEVFPDSNLSCEGLYKSGNIYCTQNEAEGFRKITFFLDRPDVMSSFKTSITANKSRFPYILSNGNLVNSIELSDDKHKTIWNDPFPKPCYLFALVAGDLGRVHDEFVTLSGKTVNLEIYVDHGNEDKTKHAMESLKNSMKWDEEVFGLEYDLDRYMIVAVDSFNMGAMENKGLNIFNSHYVLGKKETATDTNFKNIEGVIGHEYFHNWTGNRVTCRDWFQLTLKEGLTVFRDQEFSSDMGSRSVKLIEDIELLKLHQFPEDAGPLSHPIQPKSYSEINNFYTSTVYEKGAQVIRMIETLIGKANFRKGMDLYFERHDGQAVTTVDFVNAMSTASGYDLEHFKVWYDQNGTPELFITTSYNEDSGEFSIDIKQEVMTNNSDFDCLYMPFHFSLIDSTGKEFAIENDGKHVLDKKNAKIVVANINEKPTPVWNTMFSAPVKVDYNYTVADLLAISKSPSDSYSQYNAVDKLLRLEMDRLVICLKEERHLEVDTRLMDTIGFIISNAELDNEFKSYLLSIPSEKSLFDTKDEFHFEHYQQARDFLVKSIGLTHFDLLLEHVHKLNIKEEFSLSQEAIGKRALNSVLIKFLATTESPSAIDLIFNQYQSANNMTDEIASFNCLVNFDNPYKSKVKESFYNKWKDDTLVIQKWLSALSCSRDTKAEDLKKLEELEVYDNSVPNLIRSLYNGFLFYNISNLNEPSGKAYQIIIDKIIEIDKFNPQLAARMSKSLNFLDKLDADRKDKLLKELTRLKNTDNLSNDTLEIVTKNLS